MADQLQLRGGTTTEHSTFTGALREVTVDTDKDTLIVHDAATAGGHPLLREDGSNSALLLGTAGTPSIKFTGDTNTGIYSPGADQVAISTGGSARLYVAADGDVGVGTTSPTAALTVNGQARVQQGGTDQLRFYTDATTSYIDTVNSADLRIGPSGAQPLRFTTNGTERLRIDSSGRVGIGTSSPTQKLHVQAGYLLLNSSQGNGSGDARLLINQGSRQYTLYPWSGDSNSTVDLRLSTPSASNQVTITDAGNVGVGTTSPSTGLEVATGSIFCSSGGLYLNQLGGTSSTYLSYGGGNPILMNGANGALRFGTNNTERVRIDNSGRVGIGTSSPTQTLDVVGMGKFSSGLWSESEVYIDGSTATTNRYLNFRDSGTSNYRATLRRDAWYLGDPVTSIGNTTPTGAHIVLKMNGDASFDGNVGVGTTSPQAKLQLEGTPDTANSTLRITATGECSAGFSCNSTGTVIGTDTGGILFKTGVTANTPTTTGTERLRIDSSGRVGIGTSSPNYRLHAVAASENTDPESNAGAYWPLLNSSSTVNTCSALALGTNSSLGTALVAQRVGANNEHTLKFQTRNSSGALGTRMTLTGSGSVGIGTTTITNPYSQANFTDVNIDGTWGGIISFKLGGAEQGWIGQRSSGNQEMILGASSGKNLLFATNGNNERARIDSSGRLLVGTSSDITSNSSVSAFQVVHANGGGLILGRNDTTTGTNDDIGLIRFYGNDSDGNYDECARIHVEADSGHTSTSKPCRMAFYVNGGSENVTERMRLTNAGGLQTFAGTSNITARVGGTGTSGWIYWGAQGATSVTTGTQTFGVYANGNVVNTNNSYGQISDIKLKENIVDASSQWDDLKAIQVRNFNFKEGQTHTQIGVIAQEVELVSPGLVYEAPDRDEDGNDLGTVTKGVNYSVLYMKAVKALQEAMERIETLEAKVAALEAN